MIDEKLYDSIKKLSPNAKFPAPFVENLNLKITKFIRGHCEATIIVSDNWTNPYGIAHGGFLFTILDEILGSACCSMLSDKVYSDMVDLSTTNHDIFFHSPASPGDKLFINGKVTSSRKNMIFVEGNIKNINKDLIAESKGIWFVKR